MLNDIPEDILHIIIQHMDNRKMITDKPYPSDYPIIYLKSLRDTSKHFRDIVNNLKDFWKHENEEEKDAIMDLFTDPKCSNSIYISRSSNMQMDMFLNYNINKSTFIWLLDNNVQPSLQNINKIIKNNRIDLLKVGFFYEPFLKILFNRFYVDITGHNNLLSNSNESLNPIIVAGSYQRIEIIDLLLKSSTIGNPYIKEIDNLFILAIKKGYKKLLSYIVINYTDSIKDNIQKKINQIILRIDNIEDILFYLLVNDIIKPTDEIIKTSIIKNYNDLFFHLIGGMDPVSYKCKELLYCAIDGNNYVILDYLIKSNCTDFSNIPLSRILKKKKYKKEFIENIIKNHINILKDVDDLIMICFEINIDDESIITLINNDFTITASCLEKCLTEKRYYLLEQLVKKFNEVICP
tara:strand:+ start:170 stop:1393 length:1224 start_codon:yes stop_codon:yes gene_type:complete